MVSFTVRPGDVLKKYKVVAVVGASKNPEKDANTVPAYLIEHGYTVIPVNPTADVILGVRVYPSLADIPPELAKTVDIVDVFRPSDELPAIAMQTAEMKRRTDRPFVFWAQLGLENEQAKKILAEEHIDNVMDACIRTEHKMLGRSLVSFKGRMNDQWHSAHRMPENPTREQRIQWHFEHAEACGCRSVPESIGDEVRALIRQAGEGARPD